MIVKATGGWLPDKVHVTAEFVIEAVPVDELEHNKMDGIPINAKTSIKEVAFKGGALFITVEVDRGVVVPDHEPPPPTPAETLAQLEGDIQAS